MTVTAGAFVDLALSQSGDPYIFGVEVSPSDPDPDAFDCSELVQWVGARLDVHPTIPDGAYYQWRHCRNYNLAIPVQRGIDTRGALLFVGDGTGAGRAAITHVAISLGDGSTIEARGSRWGVGSWQARGRFQWACLIPGIDYTHQEDTMTPAQEAKLTEEFTTLRQMISFMQAQMVNLDKRLVTIEGRLPPKQ